MSSDDTHIEIAKVGRPHGVRGELRVFPLNPLSESLYEGAQVRWTKGRESRELTVEVMRPAKGMWLVRLADVDGRDAAASFNGGMLSVPRSSLPEPEEDEIYLHDLIGLTVVDESTGAAMGKVARLGESSVDVLDIRLQRGGSVLVPYIEQYVGAIDLQAGTIAVRDIDHWIDD